MALVPHAFRRSFVLLALTVGLLGATVVMTPRSAHAGIDETTDRRWIVVLRDDASDVPSFANVLAEAFGGEVELVYEHALSGFVVSMTEQEAGWLAQSSWVDWVEPDMPVSISSQPTPSGLVRIGAHDNPDLSIDGVDDVRIDVDVAVLDTGVDFEHPDLNVVGGVDCASRTSQAVCQPGGDDDHFHGTHVAGTIGALDNDFGVVGIAPGARIWAVKVLDAEGIGSTAGVIAGIDWVTEHADVIDVANLSLAGPGYSHAQYEAIQRAVDAGVAFSAAAGNYGTDAGLFSPAAFDNVVTVSAMADYDGLPGGLAAGTCRADLDDTLATFSNHGPAVQLTAPGTCVESTLPLELGGYGMLTGTSMAAPHVAGAMALLAAADRPGDAADVQQLYADLQAAGEADWTDTSGDGVTEPRVDLRRLSPVYGLLGPEPEPEPEPEPVLGDVDCDRTMTIIDALKIAQFSSGTRGEAADCASADPTTQLSTGSGDVNRDGSVDIIDALVIARCVTGLDTCD